MKPFSLLILLVLTTHQAVAAEKYFPPPDTKGGWRTLTDPAKIKKTTGVDVQKLDETFQYIQQTSQHGGLLVLRHGWLVYERYFGRGDREALPELASIGKAFTSLAVGIMMKEKASLIPNGLDEKVFTPKYMPSDIFPLDDPRKAEITMGQLLSMSAGIRGTNPVYINGKKQTWENPASDNGPYSTTDAYALQQTLWCAPGECYSYGTSMPHLASIVVRRLTGMEMEAYLRLKVTEPLGFGTWGYAMYRPRLKGGIDENGRMFHTPGGGSNAVRSTDMLRFGYLFLREGKWGDKQIAPADFMRMSGRMVKYNPHYAHSFNFNVNEGGMVENVPRDAYWKGGSGGYCIYVVPSLDLVIFKMGGTESQYDPKLTGLPVAYKYDGSRDGWKPGDPALVGDSTARTLQMVVAAVQK
jgi:CubicO group peptidase (beta-lactamase class C family)